MLRVAFLGAACLLALPVVGCMEATKTAWAHYDECDGAGSFGAMAACGKQKRQAYCQEHRCSDIGAALVQYADALADAVARREMTEAQARQRFVEYKTGIISGRNQNAAIAAASQQTCIRSGNVTNCY